MKKIVQFAVLFIWLAACQKKQENRADYSEQYRPQFHFSPQKGWMNDPNGLIYHAGEYHLFYQYYPDSTVWGPMHWGHAVSTDLTHWQHLPIALYPDSLGYIFSGSVVLDSANTTGFGKDNEAPLVAVFTYHNMEWEKAGRKDRESQGIAYSLDKGRTWTKYTNNPVLKNQGDVDFRDPKVFWHAPTKRWIMPLATGDFLQIFTSTNLKSWEKASEFGKNEGAHGGVWECPDLFAITTPAGIKKWVLIQNMGRGAVNGGSGTQYFVGSFDGKIFKNDNPPTQTLWLDYGADNYAGVTWLNAPNNRRLFIGWMSNWDDYANKTPTHPWRSAMTVPRELSLQKTAEGFRLFQMPVTELEKLRQGEALTLENKNIDSTLKISAESVQKEVLVEFDLSKTTATQLGFVLANAKNERVEIGYDHLKKQLYLDRTQAGKSDFSTKFAKRHTAPYVAGSRLVVRALIDNSSVEVFVDNGRIAFTDLFFPNQDFTQLTLFAKGGSAHLAQVKVYELRSIWQ
ncbi:MAG: glycoside hydrolase family 32 protein [Runella slithyformis]|nr:MAG: glycoside hydrolase family 32 protein [Runella slithyformis]